MGKIINYNEELFLEKIDQIKAEYENLDLLKKELETLTNEVTADDCWRGKSRGAFKTKSADAIKRFKHTLSCLDNVDDVMQECLELMQEEDKKLYYALKGYTKDPYNGYGSAQEAAMRFTLPNSTTSSQSPSKNPITEPVGYQKPF